MIPVFRKYCFLVIGLLIWNNLPGQDVFRENSSNNILYLNEVTLSGLPTELYLLSPVYTNAEQVKQIQPITYRISKVNTDSLLRHLQTGLYLCSFEPIVDSIRTVNIYTGHTIIQLIKKESDGYIGYLEELVNVPFVLPPRRIKEGHQTDLKIGVDCAELAIYGRRRQGYSIPYVGPRKIIDYLTPTHTIKRGTIISFGNNYQISILYEDKGQLGILDDEDLLIHAYKDKAEIVPLGKTDLKKYPFKLYEWTECP